MALKDRLIVEYSEEIERTRRLVERLDNRPVDWRPHPRSRSLGELLTHVADVPAWGPLILDRAVVDVSALPQPPATALQWPDIVERFRRNAALTQRLLDKTDAELRAVWWLKRDDEQVFSMPRTTAFRRFVLNHLVHHRGQLSVYVRMNDVAVPAIYGESADEPYAPST